jgi:hypothetical protein
MMAVYTLAPKQSQELVDEGEVVDGYGEFDVAAMAGTAQEGCKTACRAAARSVRNRLNTGEMGLRVI